MRGAQIDDPPSAGYVGGGTDGYVPPLAPGGNLGKVWPDGEDITLGTTSGSKLGTGPTQRLGLWGADPVPQPSALIPSADAVVGTAGTTYTSTEKTLINDLVALTANLRSRLNEMEQRLQSIGALPS